MGIHGLSKKINAFSEIVHINKFKGKTLAIDSSIYLYSFLTQPKKNAILLGFLNQMTMFCKNGITPIYIFDGVPFKQKLVIEKRKKIKSDNTDKFKKLNTNLRDKLQNFALKSNIDMQKRNYKIGRAHV